ncbi:hypothetical protein [Aeromonas salmonicida]|uniref:hypothetical protein n=1 Tax=Aeromonas salmonicida TaxID=645 RepID=UPI0031FD743D
MTNELPLSHYSRQWLGLVAAKTKLQPTRRGERWLLHLTPGSPNARTVTLHLRWSGLACSGNYSPSPMPRTGTP